ncbi:helix-turn-helix domain-containing protein [Oceanobacillus senegalensis]|uniref:helix-turn-helix domain-containing protein n=1 Tax=Oceanobacillus senegalensis TaxID=1936063 RepID=UPI000A305122|nr:helix-turn-helix domain-containing protein [Oceanobacillus senegalensis]
MVKKYSDDLKIKVVKDYQNGYLGIRDLAKKHNIKSKSSVGRWIRVYPIHHKRCKAKNGREYSVIGS